MSVSKAEQIEYNRWFADLVHNHGMLVGLKDAVELVPICYDDFDFAINLSCFEFGECDTYEDTFIKNGKPVFNAEFEGTLDHCEDAKELKFDSIVKVRMKGICRTVWEETVSYAMMRCTE